jgi:hypothetical protein
MHAKLFISTLLLLHSISLMAQDGHYWSENYGNKSMLLSGTVNASVEDLGLVFYNPGRLGLIENPAFAISAKVYELSKIRIEDGVDDGVDLNNDRFGGAPSLVAGTFKLPFLKDHRFAYSFLTRHQSNVDFFVRVEKEGEITDGLSGEEIFNGKLRYANDFKDEWIGLTWNPPATGSFSAGLSTFVSGLSKTSGIAVDMHALNEDNQAGYSAQNRTYSYESWAVLWKLGLAWDFTKVRLGFTLTTPRINVTGKGSTLFEDYLIGVDTTGDGNANDGFIYNAQDISNAQSRTPWAAGFGLGIPFKKGIVHLSGEWYGKVPDYTLFEMEPFVGQSTGDSVNFKLIDRLESIINFGIGLEFNFNEKVSAYASMASDYSAVPKEIKRFSELEGVTNNSIFRIDYYQFGGGFALNTKIVDITAGATYKGSSQEFKQTINFPPNEEPTNAKLFYSQWRFILGFSFPFANRFKEKVDGEL